MAPQRDQSEWGDIPNYSDRPAQPVAPSQPPAVQPAHELPGAYSPIYHQNYDAPQKKSHKKKIIAGLVAGAALLILGGGSAGAYYGYYLPNKPENVLLASIAKTFDQESLKSARFEGAAELSGEAVPTEIRGVSFEGEFNAERAFSAAITLETSLAKPKLSVLSADNKAYFLKMSGISGIENVVKLAAAGSPYESVVNTYAPLLADLNDQWYEIDGSLLGQGQESTQLPAGITEEDIAKLGDAYRQYQFIKILETLPEQEINGTKARHYKVAVNKERLRSFVDAVKASNISSLKMTDKDFDDIQKDLDGINFGKYPFEVWIDKKTKLFTQAQISASEADMNLMVRLTLKDHNAAITIQKPESPKSVLELLGQIAPQLSSINDLNDLGATLEGDAGFDNEIDGSVTADTERKADLAAMQVLLEAYYVKYGGYPTVEDFANPFWNVNNFVGRDPAIMSDPNGLLVNTTGDYTYQTTGSSQGCISPTDPNAVKKEGGVYCQKYSITAKTDVSPDVIVYSDH